MVVFNDHAHHRGAVGVGAHLHGLDLAGDTGVDGNAEPLIVTDFLTHGDDVPLLHQRKAGRADVLGHGNHHHIRLGKFLNLLVAGIPFAVLGMDPSKK